MNVGREPAKSVRTEGEVQGSARHGIALDEKLKRLVRRHPERDIAQVESVEPAEAPRKE